MISFIRNLFLRDRPYVITETETLIAERYEREIKQLGPWEAYARRYQMDRAWKSICELPVKEPCRTLAR